MNDDERGNELPVTEADTTPPNPANSAVPSPSQGWQMPEPKFQQSSGYLPQGYLDKVGFEPPPQAEASGAATATAAAPSSAAAADVEPQPDLSEQLAEPQIALAPKPAVKERSTGSRIAMIVLGLLAMAAFIAVFLAVVYYLFLAPPAGGSTF
jgi:hypothetical protein